ncbi:MAG: ATP-binding protein, partial [Candidatus Hodarchaeales archaeon]
RKFRPEDDQDPRLPQVRYDLRQDKVERRYNPPTTSIMEEMGCFEFSPRILLAEADPITLKSKLERLSVIFISNGFRVRKYPSLFRRFSSLRSMILNRKISSPSTVDGFSLMNFIAPPSRQFCHEGYSLVPNKADYLLSSGVHKTSTSSAINVGIPIISSATSGVPLLIDGKDLSRHMAVFGMTGEGKSRFVYGLVQELVSKGVKFLIFDPKGEYLRPILSFCTDFLYVKPGSSEFPWGINIFHIPMGETGEALIPEEDHIQFVSSVLEHVFDDDTNVSPQMRRMLHLAIIQTVKDKGDFSSFLHLLQQPDSLGMTGSYIENTAAGVVNRVEKLFFGNTGRCFTVSQTTFEIAHLLDHNAIIDLSAFEAMEDQSGRQIFLNVVFQYLYYYVRTFREPFKEDSLPKNVFILDEIQKLVPVKNYRYKSPESMIGRGPWTLRAYDISMFFIGTDPIIDQPMLTNTGVLTMFFTKFDPFAISNLLGIPRTEYEQLRNLLKAKPDERRCIISINGQISLLKTNEFSLDSDSPLHLDELSLRPLQQQLHESYTQFYFDPIKEILTKST